MTRPAPRCLTLATTLIGLGATGLVTAAPAHAAEWDTAVSVDRAKVQVCKVGVADGWRVKVRLDNRKADHAHLGGISSGSRRAEVRAAAGEVSRVKSIVVSPAAQVGIGIGEPTGEGAGDTVPVRQIGSC